MLFRSTDKNIWRTLCRSSKNSFANRSGSRCLNCASATPIGCLPYDWSPVLQIFKPAIAEFADEQLSKQMIDETSRGSSCGSPASHTRECQVVNRVGAVQAKSGFRSVQYLQARVVWSSANHGCTPRRFCATQFVYRAEANPIQPAHRQGGFPDRCRPEDGRFENAPQHRLDSARLN